MVCEAEKASRLNRVSSRQSFGLVPGQCVTR